MKSVVFSYYNFQVDRRLAEYQKRVMNKLLPQGVDFYSYEYEHADGQRLPHEMIDWAFTDLFFNRDVDTVLLLDVDAIPLDRAAIVYAIAMAEHGFLFGSIQRSLHIDNGAHLYVAPSTLAISKETFLEIGRPSAAPTERGDVCEEFTYRARKIDSAAPRMMWPLSVQAKCRAGHYWPLNDPPSCPSPYLDHYGIGTTFGRYDIYKDEHVPTFYHLFESRHGDHNDLFFAKCEEVLSAG
jgi:hypothetical protein